MFILFGNYSNRRQKVQGMVGRLKLRPSNNTQLGMLSRSQDKVGSRQLHHVDGKLPLALGGEPYLLAEQYVKHVSACMCFGGGGQGASPSNIKVRV